MIKNWTNCYLSIYANPLKTSDSIGVTIDRLPKGHVFTYADFSREVGSKEAVIKALNRLAKAGKIIKFAKGKYYKPESTPFGAIGPRQAEIVKDLLTDNNGKIRGYLTGLSIYNHLGLSTQISNTIQIGSNRIRPSFKRERYTISFIRQNNTITKDNIPLLQVLDAMRYIKRIPDTTVDKSCRRFLAILKNLSLNDKNALTRLAMKYPPMTRALLGAMLDQLQQRTLSKQLQASLNPITTYKIPGAGKALLVAEKWNIR